VCSLNESGRVLWGIRPKEGLTRTISKLKQAKRVRTSNADAIHDDHELLVTSTLTRPPAENE
jgi:hypothetical protein